MTSENAETQSWVTKTVWQRISRSTGRNSKTPTTTITVIFALNGFVCEIIAWTR